jgi:hypothetical protein
MGPRESGLSTTHGRAWKLMQNEHVAALHRNGLEEIFHVATEVSCLVSDAGCLIGHSRKIQRMKHERPAIAAPFRMRLAALR